MSHPIHLTEENFENEVLKSDKLVMIDFWAAWCGPCKMIAPTIEELSKEYEGKAKICKLDVDNNQRIAMDYGIRSIPTLLFFNNGQLVDQLVGAVPKNMIVEKLNSHFKH